MELNKEDGGNRKFILCTNNETLKGIAEMLSLFYIKKGVLHEKIRANKTRVKRNKR